MFLFVLIFLTIFPVLKVVALFYFLTLLALLIPIALLSFLKLVSSFSLCPSILWSLFSGSFHFFLTIHALPTPLISLGQSSCSHKLFHFSHSYSFYVFSPLFTSTSLTSLLTFLALHILLTFLAPPSFFTLLQVEMLHHSSG